jgi:cytochrome c oxidase subunit 3
VRRTAAAFLVLTGVLCAVLIAIKLNEYAIDARHHLEPFLYLAFEPAALAQGAETFFWLYFTSTGLHLVHLSIGIAIVLVLAVRAWRSQAANLDSTIEASGLYWHFVDMVWIFLYPLLYLVSRA